MPVQSVYPELPTRVRGLHVSGNYPILGKNIRKLIPLQPGDAFNENLMMESVFIVKEFLEKNGYYDSEVAITPHHNKKFNVVDLIIKIKKGKTYRVDKITVSGNEIFSTQSIKSKISKSSRFRTKRLKDNLKKIKKMYANDGYIKARVKLKKVTFNPDTRKIDIELTIKENKKLKIVFEGDIVIPVGKLRSITGLEERHSYDRYAIRNGRKRLEKYFKNQGYQNVKIKSRVLKPSKNEAVAKYIIKSGSMVELKKIDLEGNEEISDKKIKKVLLSKESGFLAREPFNPVFFSADQLSLLDLYKSQGYFDVQIGEFQIESNRFGDQKTIIFPIQEGESYKINSIQFASTQPLETAELLKKSGLKTGEFYDRDKVNQAQEMITDKLFELGHAYAHVEITSSILRDEHKLDLLIQVDLGPKVHVRTVEIEGNDITQKRVIIKNMKIYPGKLFSYQKMLEAQLQLRKLGVFSSMQMNPQGYDEKSDQIDLKVTVLERKTISANIQGGFDSRHLATGEFNFTKYNLFGTAKHFNTRMIGGPKYDRGEITFSSPRVFGASWNLANQYFVEYEDEPNFVDLNYGGYISTLKNFGSRLTFGFKEQITHTDVFEDRSNIAELGDSLFDNTFNELQLSLGYDRRDNYSDPQKGYYLLIKNELNTDLSDVRNNFDIVQVNASHHLSFLKRFTLNNTVRYGHTFEISSNPRIPVNKLFFLGGADTIRGFTEDGVDDSGGTVALVYNAELHMRIHKSLKLAGFFDTGFLSDDIESVGIHDFRESVGVGLRYFTPIGPIRLDYGFILDRRDGDPASRFHFSFGYFF